MRNSLSLALCLALLLGALAAWAAPQLKIVLPLRRVAYQTNELIDISVVRTDTADLPATDLLLTAANDEGSKLSFTFPLKAVAAVAGKAATTEHLHLNGWLLRPGNYTVAVSAYGATAQQPLEVYSHIRQSTFRLFPWGSGGNSKEQEVLGSLGYNMEYNAGNGDGSVRGGVDFMRCCTMSGGHQMDLRMECDWSDPYVLQGGEARVTHEALADRTNPNCLGVHFYDEPGLTWWKKPNTNTLTAYEIPAQMRSYKSAFGAEPLHSDELKPGDAIDSARWKQFATWKLSFMNAAWKYSQFGVSQVNPHLLSTTQSQYAWYAFTDGYYFNVVDCMPVISGHGGYDDLYGGSFCPLTYMVFGRMRAQDKTDWYLPLWYVVPSTNVRAEQNLCFAAGMQGLGTPPPHAIQAPAGKIFADGDIECTKLMGRLGTIYNTPTKPAPQDAAILYSLSGVQEHQVKEMGYNYAGTESVRACSVYIACTMAKIPIDGVVDEDVLDGSIANRKVIILPDIDYLDPKVIAALENYIAGGGAVLMTGGTKVAVKGAVKLDMAIDLSPTVEAAALWATGTVESKAKMMRMNDASLVMKSQAPLAQALQSALGKLGVAPVFASPDWQVVGFRQQLGDIDYLFVVNETADAASKLRNDHQAATTAISLPADRPVYDAVHGGAVAALKMNRRDKTQSGDFRFGAGEMRVFACPARPIGGVHLSQVALKRDLTQAQNPLSINFTVTLVDAQGETIEGVAPLAIRVLDPLGNTRYDLYRATSAGICALTLPIAANDPAGAWTVTASELLANTPAAKASFTYRPSTWCGALAGATPRAVYFGNDRENIFRFIRTNQALTLVVGTSPYCAAAADRLAESLRPWGVKCTIMTAADAGKVRPLTEEEAATWCGLNYASHTQIKPGAGNPPTWVGFNVTGPVVMIGNPQDNVLLAFAQTNNFLPYTAKAGEFPGAGRGYLAWQRDAVSYQAESLSVIAYDEAGMAEAIGSLYEAAAGLDPLTPLTLPASSQVTPATTALPRPAQAAASWSLVLPDRAVSLTPGATTLDIVTLDGTLSTVSAQGKVLKTAAADPKQYAAIPVEAAVKVPDLLKKTLLAGHVVKFLATANGLTALGYWGGAVQICTADGAVTTRQDLPQDLTALAWFGKTLVAGLSDGTVVGLAVK